MASLKTILARQEDAQLAPSERQQFASWVLGAALATALYRQGWTLHDSLGDQAYFEHDEMRIKPFEVINRLASGDLGAEAWHKQCAIAGISSLDLGDVADARQVT